MSVTIRDIARATGVSNSTVSRALAAPEKVAAVTRELIQETATAMGYRPNRAARGLITGRTSCIGLVVPDLENPYFGAISKGVQARARAAGYAVFIADTDEDPGMELEAVGNLTRQVDGVILCSARSSEAAVRTLAEGGPLVLVHREISGIPSIAYDNAGGLRSLMSHLVALGHRRIAYAGGPAASFSSGQRGDAFRSYSSPQVELDLIDLGAFPPTFSGGVSSGDLAIASGATAVVAFNDLVAAGLIDRLTERGVSVPGDISVAGFDNTPVATIVRPHLTTIDSPRRQIGRASVDLLLDLVTDTTGRPAPELGVELIVRGSTGMAPAAR